VLIGASGRIEVVGRDSDVPRPAEASVEEFPDALLLPGLINTHTHLELTDLDQGPPEPEFASWLLRLRRLKARLVAAAACEGMAEVLKPLMPEHEACSLARSWAARREPAVEKVKAALAGAELSMDHVTARTLSVRMAEFERFDRMITAAEARRASALRELDHHREYFSQRLRRALKPIEESEIGGVPAHFRGEGSI
jgi:cytosine/adenosine deaminase-related metal-dependent hydrolase